MSIHTYGVALDSSSSVVGNRSMAWMLLREQQKSYKFLQIPLLNGYTLAGSNLHEERYIHTNLNESDKKMLLFVCASSNITSREIFTCWNPTQWQAVYNARTI